MIQNSGKNGDRPFRLFSDKGKQRLIERADPEKTKVATKYGMNNFNGEKINKY